MRLIDLIPYLIDQDNLDNLYTDFGLDQDADETTIFLRDKLDIESEIQFFTYDETDGEMEVIKNGITYISLFSVDYAAELISDDLQLTGRGYTHLQIAERLLEYRIKDA